MIALPFRLKSKNEDNLSIRARFHYRLMRLGYFVQRKFLPDNWPERTILQTSRDRCMDFCQIALGGCEQGQTEDRCFFRHRLAWIDFNGAPVANHNNAATDRRQHR